VNDNSKKSICAFDHARHNHVLFRFKPWSRATNGRGDFNDADDDDDDDHGD